MRTAKLLLFLAIYLDYVGVVNKKKCGTWSCCTFFCIKVCDFEILEIGKKNRFQHEEAYSEPWQTSNMGR